MRISQEAIYPALYIESRAALKRELVACGLPIASPTRHSTVSAPTSSTKCSIVSP